MPEKEARSKVIDFTHEDEGAVLGMLRYVYNYSYAECFDAAYTSRALFDAKMYIMGVRCDLPTLQAAASASFLSDPFHLQDMGSEDLELFLELVYDDLQNSDTTLRKKVVETVLKFDDPTWFSEAVGEDVLQMHPTFAIDLLNRYNLRIRYLEKRAQLFQCPNCELQVRLGTDTPSKEPWNRKYSCPRCSQRFSKRKWYRSLIEEAQTTAGAEEDVVDAMTD